VLPFSHTKRENTVNHTDPFLRHYFRICRVHGASTTGLAAMIKLCRWADQPSQILETHGRPSWSSGFGKFEERANAITSSYSEGCMFMRQAA
jgi:hypothetical protein